MTSLAHDRPRSTWAVIVAIAAIVGLTLTPQTVATADDGATTTSDAAETYVVLEEDFADGKLPDGWKTNGGTWEVVDGRLRATGTDTVGLTMPQPAVPFSDFRFEATVQFEEVLNPSRWMHFIADGNTVTIRSQTTHSAGIEYWGANRSLAFPGPFDVGVGKDFRSVIEVRGSDLTWTIDGTEVLAVDDYVGRAQPKWGFNVNNSTIQFDDIKITDLNPQPTAPSAPVFPQLDEGERHSTIAWSAPESAGAGADRTPAMVAGYEVSAAPASVPVADVDWEPARKTKHKFSRLPSDEQQVLRVRAINSLGLPGPAAEVRTVAGAANAGGRLVTLNGGYWPSGHVQGMAVDTKRDLVYFSFTDRLVKTDKAGNVLGSVTGLPGHLGDITVNPVNGKVYGAYYWTKPGTTGTEFATAIIDPKRVNDINVSAVNSRAFKVAPVYAVDGLGFGPAFGTDDGEWLLTVALGHPYNNEYMHFAQYDVSDLDKRAVPYDPTAGAPAGGPEAEGTYSVYTGTVDYNVLQNLAYDPWLERWFMGVYVGADPQFPNYSMFAVEANAAPTMETFKGTEEQGLVIPLADDGLLHEPTGIRGWNQKADVGIQPVDNGLYYLSENAVVDGMQTSRLTLYTWAGDVDTPFAAVDGDYAWLPQIGNTQPPVAKRGARYTYDLQVRAFPRAKVQRTAGKLPPGTRLDAKAGAVVGTPRKKGTYRFSVTASNRYASVTEKVSITVR